jgi:hypothetical protein
MFQRKRILGAVACSLLMTPAAAIAFEMTGTNLVLRGSLNGGVSPELQNTGSGSTDTATVSVNQPEAIGSMDGPTSGIRLTPGFWPVALPEPTTTLMLVSGVLCLGVLARRRRTT